jgi:Flp pilus assembly protein TadG
MIRRMLKALTDQSGAAAVEFAFIAPVLFLLVMGIAQFGITLNNYVILTDAVGTGARQLAVSRGASTPRTTTVTMLQGAATGLVTANITITTRVNGTACATDSTCSTALASAAGQAASVTATYPCDLTVMGYNYAPGCTLSSTMSERIE